MTVDSTPPPDYRETRMRGLWARIGCTDCGGTGEFIVTDDDDPDLRYPQPCDCLWCPEAELERDLEEQDDPDRQAELERELHHRHIALAMNEIDEEIGPRRTGRRYWSGYWSRGYTVESISITCDDGDLTRPSWSMRVRWDDGHRTTHCTPWAPELDDGQPPVPPPPGPAPRPPELYVPRRCAEAPCSRCTSRFALIRAAHRIGLL